MPQNLSDDSDVSPASAAHDGDNAGSGAGSGTAPVPPTEGQIGAGATATSALDNPVEPSGAPQGHAMQAHLPGGGTEPAAGFLDQIAFRRGFTYIRIQKNGHADPAVMARLRDTLLKDGWSLTQRGIWHYEHPPVVRHDLSGVGGSTDQQAQEGGGDESH